MRHPEFLDGAYLTRNMFVSGQLSMDLMNVSVHAIYLHAHLVRLTLSFCNPFVMESQHTVTVL